MVTRSVIRITAAEAAAAKSKAPPTKKVERSVRKTSTDNEIGNSKLSDTLPGCGLKHSKSARGCIDSPKGGVAKKRDGPIEASKIKSKKRKRSNSFSVDLSDVPPQSPILKSKTDGRVKDRASKYTGVSWNAQVNKWCSRISIEGKTRYIGYYENEEEAGIDYARAVSKYKRNKKPKKRQPKKRQRSNSFTIDLSDVPPQPPIPKFKTDGRMNDKASKFTGVSWEKNVNKWKAQIFIEGKLRCIGYYENEEDAGIDYARASFKYNRNKKPKKRQRSNSPTIDLSDVPPQSPITRDKSDGRMKNCTSKYVGVAWNASKNKWFAHIFIEGKNRHIGCYENENDAGIDYARAVFKYKSKDAREKPKKRRRSNSFIIDLSDVPPQSPITRDKSEGQMNGSDSKYIGVTWDKKSNKWVARIRIEGKQRRIGFYDNEEGAGTDYARAVYKYKGEEALTKSKKSFINDLSDVPPQSPIIRDKSDGRMKNCTSKFTGVAWSKKCNKWSAHIFIEGKNRHIGFYENEEEAGIDYARAVYKYKGKEALDKARIQASQIKFVLDLSDVPLISPILKSGKRVTEGLSRYVGVYFHKGNKRWSSQILLKGKQCHIGSYESEEKAAINYARALLKYRGQEAVDNARKHAA